jgi:hypothetical protein
MSQDLERRTQSALRTILGGAAGLTAIAVRDWRDGDGAEVYPAVLLNCETAGQCPEDTGHGPLMELGVDVAVQTDLANDLGASLCNSYMGYVRDRLKSATLDTTLSRHLSATCIDWELSPGAADISEGEINMRSLRLRLFVTQR